MRNHSIALITSVLFVFCCCGTTVCAAQQQTTVEADASAGFHHYNVKGFRGKLGEYDVLDSGTEARFSLSGTTGGSYFNAHGSILDEDDQTYRFYLDAQRIFQTDLTYRRFNHFLDHDPLANQDSVRDFDVGRDNVITLQEMKAENTLRIPALPFLRFTADYRNYTKRGQRQATTVSKCAQCHVSSRNKRINESTDDITLGVEGTLGPATITYQHLWRSFKEDARAPVNDYGDGASLFTATGPQSYSRVPDSKTRIHKVRLSSRLPFASSLYASYQWGERTNNDTHNDVDFSNVAFRLSKYVSRYLSCDVFYNNYRMDNDAPDGKERDIEKGGINLNGHFIKRTNVKLSYQWENIDRDNFDENSTRKERYRITVNKRILKKFRLHARYEKTKIDDAFITRDDNFNTLVQTSLPKSQDELYISANWSPRAYFSLTTNLRYIKSENHRYEIDEDRYEFVLSFWYVPFEPMTLSGSFTYIDNQVDTPSAYKTYHLRDPESVFLYDRVPYDDRSQAVYFSATYQLNPRLALTGDGGYMWSRADFDTQLDSTNIGEFSDLEIEQLQTSLGLTYLYSRNVLLYAKYIYREYDDKVQNFLDGQFSLISFGVNWTF